MNNDLVTTIAKKASELGKLAGLDAGTTPWLVNFYNLATQEKDAQIAQSEKTKIMAVKDLEGALKVIIELEGKVIEYKQMFDAQVEFTTHEVENIEDWTDWVCPEPNNYLMKCCDCGLVHEMQTRVAKYKPEPSEEFEVVKDVDTQAQFRMRRHEATHGIKEKNS